MENPTGGRLDVVAVPWDHPGAALLRREMFDDVARLYPESWDRVAAIGGYAAHDARGADGVVAALLATAAGEPVGFVAVGRLELAGEHGTMHGAMHGTAHVPVVAELRRMYVRPAARGRGVAQALLVAAEEVARAAGLPRVVLETGTAQVAAQRLYASCGYQRIAPYPPHDGDPTSLCFAKDLAG